MKQIFLSILSAVTIVSYAQVNQDIFVFKNKNTSIKHNLFYNNLSQTLKDSTVGYGILITKSGKTVYSKQGGFRITPPDDKFGKGVPFDLTTRMHIASVTKTITAVALTKLLSEKNISIKEPFLKYIPSYWQVHPSFQKMSIETLLHMESGIKTENDALTSSLDSLQMIIEKGVNAADTGKFFYANTNYALLKIIIAYLSDYKEYPYFKGYDRNDAGINNTFLNYINDNLFKPAGIARVYCHSTEADPTLMYPFPYNNELGFETGKGGVYANGDDLTYYSGGLGLYLSVTELNKFINTLLFSEKILKHKSLVQLTTQKFPFTKRVREKFYYSYAMGLWIEGTVSANYFGGINACVFCLPDKTVAVIFVNSYNNNAPLLNKRILQAFENSLE